MAAGAGVHAVRHVPGAHLGRVLAALLAGLHALALRARAALGLEGLVRLLGRGFAADGQAAVRLARAAAAVAVFAYVVEAAQLAAFVGGAVAAHVAVAARVAAHHRLAGLALAQHRHQGQCGRCAVFQAHRLAQRLDLGLRQFLRLAAQQRLRQAHLAVADALQARHLAALRFPQPAHFAVAALLQQHAEPVVRVGAADAFDLVELGRAVVQRHAAGETVDDLVADHVLAFRRAHAADVLARDLEAGMHHRVGQLAVGGEQQQAGGVDVEAADRDPARALQRGQGVEDGRAALGVLAAGHFAFRLVVHQHARGIGQRAGDEGLAVDLDLVAAGHAHAGARGLAVDLDQAVGDALLQRAARAQAGLRQHLVQAFLDARGLGGFRGGGLRPQAQRAAGGFFLLLAHWFCSDDASSASSPSLSSWSGAMSATVSSASASEVGSASTSVPA